VFRFSLLISFTDFDAFLNLRRNERDIVINVHPSSCKVFIICDSFNLLAPVLFFNFSTPCIKCE